MTKIFRISYRVSIATRHSVAHILLQSVIPVISCTFAPVPHTVLVYRRCNSSSSKTLPTLKAELLWVYHIDLRFLPRFAGGSNVEVDVGAL